MKGKIKDNIVKLVGKAAPRPVGDITHENEAKTAEEALLVLSKEARKTLNAVGSWHQDFHGNELVSCMAMLLATSKVAKDKELALSSAILFIGSFEHNEEHGEKAMAVLQEINQILAGESIEQSLEKNT